MERGEWLDFVFKNNRFSLLLAELMIGTGDGSGNGYGNYDEFQSPISGVNDWNPSNNPVPLWTGCCFSLLLAELMIGTYPAQRLFWKY